LPPFFVTKILEKYPETCYNKIILLKPKGANRKIMKTKKRGGSFFSGLLTFVLLVVIAATVAANLIFTKERIPKIADYYLYLQDSDEMEDVIPKESLVIAKAASTSDLHEGNTVLCYLSDGTRAARIIYKIEETDDGTVNYYPGTVNEQGSELVIPRMNIFAVCTWASPELYQFIRFATSVTGLMALLVAPCVILIIMFLIKISRNNTEDMDDEDFDFDEEENDEDEDEEEIVPVRKKAKPVYPLYDPDKAVPQGLAEKKSSISENFAEKPVNENSPYQKAVQEHEKTTKFRREEIEAEALRALEEPRKKKSDTPVYSPADESRKDVYSQTQTFPEPSAPPAPKPAAPVPPPPVQPPAQPEVIQEAPAVAPVPAAAPAPSERPKPKPTPAPAPKRSSSPNIDDILKPSEYRKSGTSSSDSSQSDSIDDLIRVLESQKKK